MDHERVVGWNTAAMTEEDTEAAELLWMQLANDRGHLDAECTADEVEPAATWCQGAMYNVLDTTAMTIRISSKDKRWWNANTNERRKVVGKDNKRRRISEEASRAMAELLQSI